MKWTTEDELEDLLRQEIESIPDDGFTDRVMASLPERKSLEWRRSVILLSTTLVGGFLALFVLPGGELLTALLANVSGVASLTLWPISSLFLLSILTWVTFLTCTSETTFKAN